MELITEPFENKVQSVTKEKEIELMFESLLLDSTITKEVQLTPSFKLTMKTLSTQDILSADTLYIATVAGVPKDVVDRVRTVSTLSFAVTAVNDKPLYGEDTDVNSVIREKMNKQLLSLPPALIDRLRVAYSDMVMEQNALFEKVGENVENF